MAHAALFRSVPGWFLPPVVYTTVSATDDDSDLGLDNRRGLYSDAEQRGCRCRIAHGRVDRRFRLGSSVGVGDGYLGLNVHGCCGDY